MVASGNVQAGSVADDRAERYRRAGRLLRPGFSVSR
jgi:hypothetical protein